MKIKQLMFIILMLAVICIASGCQKDTKEESKSSKKILYKMNIEEMPYINLPVLAYSYTDSFGNRVSFIISSDDSCSYYATIRGKTTSRQENFRTCDYSVKENKLTLNINVKKMIWLNNGDDSFISDTYEDITLYGEFDRVLKQLTLTIDNKDYNLLETTYQKMLEANMEYALYDPETNDFYDLNGLSIIELEYEEDGYTPKKRQLDLSNYDIQVGYVEHEPWSTED